MTTIDTQSLTATIMAAVEDNSLVLPTLPEVAIRIKRCEHNPNLDAVSLARTIEHDPATTAQLMRIANSPLVRREVKIADLARAVSLLGVNYSAKLAVSLSAKQLFASGTPALQTLMREIWRHSMNVACHCYVLARLTDLVQEEAFLAGLLHSIGSLPVITAAAGGHYDTEETRDTIRELHPMLGERILTSWEFPRIVTDVPLSYQEHSRHIDRIDYCDLVTLAHNHLAEEDKTIPWNDVRAVSRIGWNASEAEEEFSKLDGEVSIARDVFEC